MWGDYILHFFSVCLFAFIFNYSFFLNKISIGKNMLKFVLHANKIHLYSVFRFRFINFMSSFPLFKQKFRNSFVKQSVNSVEMVRLPLFLLRIAIYSYLWIVGYSLDFNLQQDNFHFILTRTFFQLLNWFPTLSTYTMRIDFTQHIQC